MLNRSPDEALTEINARGRRPLTISETSLGCCMKLGGSRTQGCFEVCFQPTPNANEVRVPLQLVRHIVEASVVQFIQRPQRQLRIVWAIRFRRVRKLGGFSAA